MSEEERKFLEIVDLKKGFGSGETRQEVLRGMNFSVAKGEFCVLLGPSGSGKSTLLNIIGGIDSADSGYISINGDKLKDMSEKKLTQYRRKHLGYVFQMYNLIANLNVKENIEVGAYLSDNALDIDELLHTLGLYEHRYKLPNQLYFRFLRLLIIVPMGSIAFSTMGGNRTVNHTVAAYCKYFLSVTFEAVTMALAIIVCNAFINAGLPTFTSSYADWAKTLIYLCEMTFTIALTVGSVKGAQSLTSKAFGL